MNALKNIDLSNDIQMSITIAPEESLKALEMLLQFQYTKLEMTLAQEERLFTQQCDKEIREAEIELQKEVVWAEAEVEKAKKLASSGGEIVTRASSSGARSKSVEIPMVTTSTAYDGEDAEFNKLTGFNQLLPTHIGKISKTALMPILTSKSAEIEAEWPADRKKNLNDSTPKLRVLLRYLLLGSITEQRLDRWSNAPDGGMLMQIREEIQNKLRSYDAQSLIAALDWLKEWLKKHYEGTDLQDLRTSLYAEVIEQAYGDMAATEQKKEEFDVRQSPLGVHIAEVLSYMDEASSDLLLEHFLVKEPKAGMDQMASVVTGFSEKYPIPAFEEEARAYKEGIWEDFHRDHTSKMTRYFFNTLCDIWQVHYKEHMEWLERRSDALGKKK